MIAAGTFLPRLNTLYAGANRFSALGDLSVVAAAWYIMLSNNPMDGESLPPSLWEDLPLLISLDVSFCNLSGTIPAPSALLHLHSIKLSNNQLTGSLPLLLSATTYDVSSNELSGPVDFDAVWQMVCNPFVPWSTFGTVDLSRNNFSWSASFSVVAGTKTS